MKKIAYFLQRNDGIWSIPLSFILLLVGNLILNKYFGNPILSLEYVEPLFLVAVVMVVVNTIAYIGANLNQRSLQRYFYSREIKKDMDKWGVHPVTRILLYLMVYAFYFICSLLLFVYFSNLWFVHY